MSSHIRVQSRGWRGAVCVPEFRLFAVIAALLFPSPGAYAGFYTITTEALVNHSQPGGPTVPGTTAYDQETNGSTLLCTPTGPGACAPISQVYQGRTGTAFSLADLTAGMLLASGSVAGASNATILVNGNLTGISGPTAGTLNDVILHIDFGWGIDGGNSAFSRLTASIGNSGSTNGSTYDTPNALRTADYTGHIDLPLDIIAGDGYLFQFGITLSGSVGSGFLTAYNAWASFWLELPDGASVVNGVASIGNIPLAAPATVISTPGGVLFLAMGMVLLRRRQTTGCAFI